MQIKPLPFENVIKCDWIHCTNPIGIMYEMGCCNKGMWWHSSCPNYENEREAIDKNRQSTTISFIKTEKEKTSCY